MSVVGIQETMDVMKFADKLIEKIIIRVKEDGIGFDDIAKLLTDEELKLALINMVNGIKSVPAEVKDLDLSEGVQLAMVFIMGVPRYVDALKKK